MKIFNEQRYHNFILALQFWIHIKSRRFLLAIESLGISLISSRFLLSLFVKHSLKSTAHRETAFSWRHIECIRALSTGQTLQNEYLMFAGDAFTRSHAHTHVARVLNLSRFLICYQDVYSCTHISWKKRPFLRIFRRDIFDSIFFARFSSLHSWNVLEFTFSY